MGTLRLLDGDAAGPTWCARRHTGHWDTLAEEGSGFCRPCLDYLVELTDVDPLGPGDGK